ncbi:TetR/AcrR family transcriptional regulator [Nocardia miyunensis]|uniref:TetR/AcrR family transcriptional regulator n=1 Tax=Nocardia miyunensis TaxID=282684 RepID=UPI0008307593|nr:TetR/AcrR family transcriptional regulator [Nocardia miyunensis]
MPELPEHNSPKAARVLAAAGELLLSRGSRGVTIAEVAHKAHIGKGTVYLYWKTKEDLLLGLIARDFLALVDEHTAAITADPDLIRPSRMCPRILHDVAEHPFVQALQSNDEDLLGALADDPRATTLLDTLGPDALLHTVLPVWRDNGFARSDWPLTEQVFALHALTTGFIATTSDRRSRLRVSDPGAVLAAAVTALLGPEQATPQQANTAVAEAIRMLAEARSVALNLLGLTASASEPAGAH